MKKTFNWITLILLLLYFSYIISRIILKKLPQNPIVMITIVVLVGILSKLILTIIQTINKRNQENLKKGKPKENLIKILIRPVIKALKEITVKLEKKFHVDFLRKFLGQSKNFVKFMFLLMKAYECLEKNELTVLIFNIVLIIPWILVLISFFFEILTQKPLLITLYMLSFSFVVNRLFFFSVNLVLKNALDFQANVLLSIYFSAFSTDLLTRSFFVSNPMLKNIFFFSRPEIQNRNTLIFCWKTFSEILYFAEKLKTLEVQLISLNKTKKLLSSKKLLYFALTLSCFILNFAGTLGAAEDLIFAFIFFLGFFLDQIINLNFLINQIEDREKYHSIEDLRNSILENSLATKEKLLKKYSFLQENDLPNFLNTKSSEKLVFNFFHLNQDRFIDCELTNEELEAFLLVGDDLYQWFLQQIDLGMINFSSLTYNYHKFEEVFGKNP